MGHLIKIKGDASFRKFFRKKKKKFKFDNSCIKKRKKKKFTHL